MDNEKEAIKEEISKTFGNEPTNDDKQEETSKEQSTEKTNKEEQQELEQIEGNQDVKNQEASTPNETEEEQNNTEQQEQTIPSNDLATGISIDKYVQAELKGVMAVCDIEPKKLGRAVRLIDPELCMENGMFSEQKAQQEVEKLLTEWPELKRTQIEATGNSFSFGAPQQKKEQEENSKSMFSSIFGNK